MNAQTAVLEAAPSASSARYCIYRRSPRNAPHWRNRRCASIARIWVSSKRCCKASLRNANSGWCSGVFAKRIYHG